MSALIKLSKSVLNGRSISAFNNGLSGKRLQSTLFQLNEKQREFQEKCRNFAEKELVPTAEELDRESKFPENQIHKLSKLDLMGVCIDPKYGGAGLDLLSTCIAVEELSRGCASTGIIVSIHNCLYAELVQRVGTCEQKEEFLGPFTTGQIGVFALSEHEAGSDVANISTLAREDGDFFVLNGSKAWVTSGYEAKAGVFFATIDKGLSHKGITAFLIPFDTPGVMLGRKEDKLGIRATSTCDIVLQDVRVPKKNVLGSVGTGFEIAMHQLQLGRIGVAAQALGIGQASLDLAINYGLKRELFGKHLTDLQLIRAKISRMAVDLEAARLLTWKAATLRDTNQDFRKLSSMAKFAASRCATNNAHNCVQILGAKGFVAGLGERYFRDSRITEIYGGVTDIQQLIIAEQVIKNYNVESGDDN